MMTFAPVRTRRLSVQLRELTTQEIIGLLKMPPSRPQAEITQFLRHAAERAAAPTPAHVTDPREWTVQERTRLVAHYIAHVSDDGGDFRVGDGRASDYTIIGDEWDGRPRDVTLPDGRRARVWPLLGWMAEALERVCQSAGEWQAGACACQTMMDGESLPNVATAGDMALLDWAKGRVDAFLALPESDFLARMAVWNAADTALTHHYALGFADDGLTLLPTPEAVAAAGAQGVAPGRFRISTAFDPRTVDLFGRAV